MERFGRGDEDSKYPPIHILQAQRWWRHRSPSRAPVPSQRGCGQFTNLQGNKGRVDRGRGAWGRGPATSLLGRRYIGIGMVT